MDKTFTAILFVIMAGFCAVISLVPNSIYFIVVVVFLATLIHFAIILAKAKTKKQKFSYSILSGIAGIQLVWAFDRLISKFF